MFDCLKLLLQFNCDSIVIVDLLKHAVSVCSYRGLKQIIEGKSEALSSLRCCLG